MDIKLVPMPGIEKLEDLKKEYTQNNECKKFECVNLKDNDCVYEDEDVMCACGLCEFAYECENCKHKVNCNKRKSQ